MMGRTSSLLAAGLLAASASARPWSVEKRQSQNDTMSMVYSFADITPSEEIKWQPCFESFDCTYLTVPLDYKDASAGTTDVAFVKWTSENGTGQDILYNPGGPGGSGVDGLVSGIDTFIKIFGTDYNWVSFDPRGVNSTSLRPSCYYDVEERSSWYSSQPQQGSAPLPELWSAAVASGEHCNIVNERTDAKYVGTSAVVQDMIHFTELQAKANNENPEDAKIWFYGVSYGTVIAQTLATMYPDRIGRVISDANVYGVEHYRGYNPDAIRETDVAFEFFFTWCAEAGPDLCALADSNSSSTDVESRYRAVLKQLEEEPLVVEGTLDIITRKRLEKTAFQDMYAPQTYYFPLALQVAALENGNGSLYNTIDALYAGNESENYTSADSYEAQVLITAVDGAGRHNLSSLQDYLQAADDLDAESIYVGDSYARSNPLLTTAIDILPPGSQLFPGFSDPVDTSNPVLFVGGTGDPITPLVSAIRMAAFFSGSGVLAHNAPGHSFQAVPSACVINGVRAYLKDATLPDPDTLCQLTVGGEEVFKSGQEVFERLISSGKKMKRSLF